MLERLTTCAAALALVSGSASCEPESTRKPPAAPAPAAQPKADPEPPARDEVDRAESPPEAEPPPAEEADAEAEAEAEPEIDFEGAPCSVHEDCDGGRHCLKICEGVALLRCRGMEEQASLCLPSEEREPLSARRFMFVVRAGALYGVLPHRPKPEEPGRLRVLDRREELVSIGRPAKREEVPEALRGLRGSRLLLHGARGQVCRARAGRPWLVGRVQRRDALREKGGRSPAEFAGKWKTFHLALRLRPRGSCKGALWAHHAELDPPTRSVAPEPPPEELARAAREEFRAHPLTAAFGDTFTELDDGGWSRHGDEPVWSFTGKPINRALEVRSFSWDDRTFVTVSAAAGDLCAMTSAIRLLWEVREEDGGYAFEEIPMLPADTSFFADAVTDVDGDGAFELLQHGRYWAELWSRTAVTRSNVRAGYDEWGC